MNIPLGEAEFHALSYVSPHMRLFWWRDRLYRGVAKSDSEFYREFFQSAFARTLMKDGLLVETDITDLVHPDFDLVLEHKILPVISYVHEWSFDALQQAALLMLRLQSALMANGFHLRDPHPWNILFDGTKPVFMDAGAIRPAHTHGWLNHDAVHRYYLHPLRLLAAGHGRIARALLRQADQQGIYDAEAYAILGGFAGERLKGRVVSTIRNALPPATRRRLRKKLPDLSAASLAADSESARREISSLRLCTNGRSGGDGKILAAFPPKEDWSLKQRSVDAVLETTRPQSVLDIGSNHGWYSELAARRGARVVALDIEEQHANGLYRRARETGLDVQPLVMDLRGPSGGAGLFGRLFPPATQRLKSELVMALSLVHHLALRDRLTFGQIVEALSEFSTRWLLVEFVPRGDGAAENYGNEYENPEQAWEKYFGRYDLENFKTALGARFSRIAEFPSAPEPRRLLLCEK